MCLTICAAMVVITIRIVMGRLITIAAMATPATRPRRARFPSRPTARSEASEVPHHTIPSPSKAVLAQMEQKRAETWRRSMTGMGVRFGRECDVSYKVLSELSLMTNIQVFDRTQMCTSCKITNVVCRQNSFSLFLLPQAHELVQIW